VKLVTLKEGEKLQAVARVMPDEGDEDRGEGVDPSGGETEG
jgi:hypothetical protein